MTRFLFFILILFLGIPVGALQFPEDHGFHKDFQLEWCYFVGNLISAEGEELGYELSFFRAIPYGNEEIFPVHFAISETGKKIHHSVDTLHRRFGGMAEYNPSLIRSGDFKVEILGSSDFLISAFPRGKKISLQLRLTIPGTKDILPQGIDGISPKSRKYPEIFSYYYSIPRLSTSGKIRVGEKEYLIQKGLSWMDHEWSGEKGKNREKISSKDTEWDWICINLEDGTDIMAFNFRNSSREKSESFGTVRDKDGKIIYFHKEGEVVFAPGKRRWMSEVTKKQYTMEWSLKIGEYDFRIESSFDAQEFVANNSTLNSYWEGGVRAVDSRGRNGRGYMELK